MQPNSTGLSDEVRAQNAAFGQSDARNTELAAISRTVSRLKSDPHALRQAMQRAGILSETGQLTEDYQA
jgi:hypothetical protein